MEDLFRDYWWLLFPFMGFAFGGYGMWLNYRRSRDALELIKTYAAQGKEPPPGLIQAVSGDFPEDGWENRRAARRDRRFGPYGEVRRLITFSALAGGFGFAAWWAQDGNVQLAFGVVAFVMGAMAVGSLLLVFLQRNGREPK